MAETQNPTGESKRRSARRELIGIVTSDKMQKTVVVAVTHRIRSAQYKKYMTKRVKYKAHSEKNEYHVGDRVLHFLGQRRRPRTVPQARRAVLPFPVQGRRQTVSWILDPSIRNP